MFELTMHPASEGDALVLSWGADDNPHHAVIDLGRTKDYRALRPWLKQASNVELFVMSHIDGDHIFGAMPMVREDTPPFSPGDVWFNGYHHLVIAKDNANQLEALAPGQGEKLSDGIKKFDWPWNNAFHGSPVSIDTPVADAPISLPGGLRLTLLSPADDDLTKLEKIWARHLRSQRMRPADPDDELTPPTGLEALSRLDVDALAAAPFKEDDEASNGSSISFLAEFDGKCILLGADAHPSRIASSLEALGFSSRNRISLDLFKLCHHGSKANTSQELLEMVECKRFAISTDGTSHNHPNPETLARVIKADPNREKTFFFNTIQPNTAIWDNPTLMERWKYSCVFPESPSTAGLKIKI